MLDGCIRATALDHLDAYPLHVAYEVEGSKKKPIQSANGYPADITTPQHLAPFSEAVERARILERHGKVAGCGIVLGRVHGKILCAIDLDKCLDGDVLAPWAEALLLSLKLTFVEKSLSGTGLHVYFYIAVEDQQWLLEKLGIEPGQWGKRRPINNGQPHIGPHGPALEIYTDKRYFARTDEIWSGHADVVATLDRHSLEDVIAAILAGWGEEGSQEGSQGWGSSTKWGQDRSADSLRVAHALKHAGKASTIHELLKGLLADPDPRIGAWVSEKGLDRNQHELKRLWQKIWPDGDPEPGSETPETPEAKVIARGAEVQRQRKAAGERYFAWKAMYAVLGSDADPEVVEWINTHTEQNFLEQCWSEICKADGSSDHPGAKSNASNGANSSASDGGNGPSSRSATLPILYQASRIDVSKIPPREWLLGTTFCCKNLSGLIGAGGDGKTTIRICQYLALATGRSFTGEKVYRKGRVLLGSFEDDRAEIERRLGAAMLYHNISSNEIEDRLIYYCPKDKLATIGPWGVWQIGGLDKELRAIIAEYKVDLVAIDPIIKAHGVPESDNNAMDRVAGMLTSIAHDLNCAVDTVLHARKQLHSTPGDVDMNRGASAVANAGRLMCTVTRMTSKEAKAFRVDEVTRHSLVRVDDAKVNLTLKSSRPMWFQLVGVQLPNANGSTIFPDGDNVQTVERWYPPGDSPGLDYPILKGILDEIDAGPGGGVRYSSHHNAKGRHVSNAVLKVMPDQSEDDAKHLAKWVFDQGYTEERPYHDPVARAEKNGLFVIEWPIPPAEDD